MKREILFRGFLYLGSIGAFILNIIQKQMSALFLLVSTIGVVMFAYFTYWISNITKKKHYKLEKKENYKPINSRLYFSIAISIFLIVGIFEYIANRIENYAFIFALGLSIASMLNDILKNREKES